MARWLISVAACFLAGRACADGGILRLRQQAGDYRVAVFTSPALLRAGPIDVSVLVQDAATGKHLPQSTVTVYLREQDGPATLELPATIGVATNKLFHAAEFDLPHAGRWSVEVALAGQQGSATVKFDIEAAEPLPPWLEVWPWIAWPAGAVILFGIHQLLVRRASDSHNSNTFLNTPRAAVTIVYRSKPEANMKHTTALVTLLAVLSLRAADEPLVPEDAKVEKLWGEGEFTEGPAHGPDGCIYFSDIGNRIMKFDPATKKTTEYRNPSGRANGLDFDAEGRLVACEGGNTGGNRRITITEKDGKVRVLADKWMDKRFNSPNDLTIDTKGRIYFTDPRYTGTEQRDIDTESVYRIDRDGTVTQIIKEVKKPNGIILSPDMKTLFLAESDPKGDRQLLSFPLKADGSVGEKKVLHDFGKDRGIDGMSIDTKGRIWATAGRGKTAGVYIFTPEGKKLGFIATPEDPTNCVFGGKDRKMLYVTAGKSLYRIHVNADGFAIFWPKSE